MNYIDVIVNHYNNLKGSITYEELQAVYSSVYPDSKIKLNKEDWAICNIAIESDNSQKIYDQFEKINNRIDISKSSSFQTSEIFVNKLVTALQPYNKDIYGFIEPFCDNREQGLMLSLYNQKTDDCMHIWACESKTNGDLMVITSDSKTKENLYMADDIDKAQYYKNGVYDEAIKFSLSKVNQFLDKDLNISI